VYRVPDSHVIISGHQKGNAAGLLFGVIGVAIAHSMNSAAGGDSVKDIESKLHIKLDNQVDASLKQILGSGKYAKSFTQADAPGNTRLLITPALVLSYITDTDLRPYVILKASLQGADSKPIWTTRYIASTGMARPLVGANGWLENDAAELKSIIQNNINVAMQTMVNDVSSPYPRDETKLTMVQGHFPYLKQRFQTVGFQLNEDERYLTFVPRLGDVLVFAGVNIFDKNFTTYRAATKEDAIFKVVEDPVVAKQ
jgi:hypothetical protein